MTQDLTAAVERVREYLDARDAGFTERYGEPVDQLLAWGELMLKTADLRALLSAVTWRPISEYNSRTDDCDVLVCDERGAVGEARLHDEGWYWANTDPTDYHDGRAEFVTHFLPLPPPPEAK